MRFFVVTPERHYHGWVCIYWCVACKNGFNGLSGNILRTKKEIKSGGNFGYMGRSDHLVRS